ncbi:MAG: hypothetical protein Q8P58_03055 [Candidatus Adlerbacteria bacterium]|nr:hypothetical protein [Candidatus Adlerbacteria bacterium]
MDPQVSTSFIPKKPLTEGRRGSSSGLIFLLALLIFTGSVVAAGAAFLYGTYLNNALTAKARSLETAQGAFESAGAIENLIRLDSRIKEAKSLLGEHVAPSAIFYFLSAQTLERVRFTSFDFGLKEDGSATVELKGVTDGFPTIALQSDQLGASKVLRNIIFSDIVVEEGGDVSFSLSATVDPALLLYSKNLTQGGSVIVPPVETPIETSTPTATGTPQTQ